jgi:hypothetical protein
MSNGFKIAHPPILNADNGRAYKMRLGFDLRNAQDALKLKKIEAQCLADICRSQAREIKNKNATIALLQKRIAAANAIAGGRP